jgi:serine/threonine protein kinase
VERTGEGRYLLTGNTGSLRYMAPEVARDEPYNLSVDSYSFGILFWQICSLSTPYAGLSQESHAIQVVRNGARPKPDASWPNFWVDLMEASWSANPADRPFASELVSRLEQMVRDTSMDEGVVPTRASEIRAKKKKHKVAPANQVLDADTRISSTIVSSTVTASNGIAKQHDGDIV